MKNKLELKIILQPRDYKMLQFIYEMEYCSLKSLWIYIFDKKVILKTVLTRISKLKRAGYIGSFKTQNYYVYYLKSKSLESLRYKFSENKYSNNSRQLSLANIDHTVTISEIRAVLESSNEILSFTSEKTLRISEKNQKKYIPDGIIYKNDEIQVFELERTLKSNIRIDQRIDELRDLFAEIKTTSKLKVSAYIVCQSQAIKKKYDQSLYSVVFHTKLLNEIIN